VDNGTDKVYQYVGAAGRTSGSQNAAATFALATGDTNPQGIADPPPADLLLSTAAVPTSPSVAPSAGGVRSFAAALGQVFAGSQVAAGPGWVWGSDLFEAFLSLSRKDSQGTIWGF
jgi:hypothetical protein